MDDRLIQELINIYKNAQQDLIRIISEKNARGNVTDYQKSLLRQIGQQLAELDKLAKDISYKIVEQYYREAVDEVSAVLDIDKDESYNNFAGIHTDAINTLAYNTYLNLNQANNFVGRRLNDVIRKAGLDAIAQQLTTGLTVKQCKQNLVNALTKQGINGIQDRRGRLISLDSYAEIVARSTAAEATNTGTVNHLTSNGYDLVQMSEHGTLCPICAIYQGRVYSITGKDKRFPKLDMVPGFSSGYNNIHPRCRHRILPYVPDLATDLQGDIENSNRSFDIDPRSKAQIEAYDNEQRNKTQFRNDRNQYERYKLVFLSDAPKTFSGFRKMKLSNSERFQELQSEYRSIMRKEDNK